MKIPLPAILDLEMERSWTRLRRLNLLVTGAYFLCFLLAYAWMQAHVADEALFFGQQLSLSRALLATMGLHLAATLVLQRRLWGYRWRQFFGEPSSPHALALLRIVFSTTTFTHLIFYVPHNWLPLASLPHSARQPLPLIGWLIDIVHISPTIYTVAIALGIMFSFLAAIGLWTRAALLALIPLTIYLFGVPQFFGKLSHYHFFVWITMILAFTPCGKFWSVDALVQRLQGIRVSRGPSMENAMGIRWLMLSLVGIYFFSGVHKLYDAGLFWALSDNPVNLLRTEWLEQFESVPLVRVDLVPWLCKAAAIGVIVFELAYPFMLLGTKSRRIAALEAIVFHNLNGYFLKIDFTYLKAAHIPYFNLQKPIDRLRKKQHRWQAWLLLFLLTAALGWFLGMLFMAPIVLMAGIVDISWQRIGLRKRVAMLQAIARRLPAPKNLATRQLQAQRWLRWSMRTGILLIVLNWTCGALGIHSWPFSAYPYYTFLRADTVRYGWFIPLNESGAAMDLDSAAEAANFRKENILPMAEQIVQAWENDRSQLEGKILQCWLRWRTEVPALQSAQKAHVVIQQLPLDPSQYGHVISEIELGELRLTGSEWHFFPKI